MQTNRPQPPDDLDGEALLEWHRICDELAALGTLDKSDRAAITLYCQTWAINQQVGKHVAKFGSVIKWSNGVPGQSPWFKTQKETATLLIKLLDQLGLTPSSRSAPATDDAPQDISF
jgi:P27 family predicted phage terminase small subunit